MDRFRNYGSKRIPQMLMLKRNRDHVSETATATGDLETRNSSTTRVGAFVLLLWCLFREFLSLSFSVPWVLLLLFLSTDGRHKFTANQTVV